MNGRNAVMILIRSGQRYMRKTNANHLSIAVSTSSNKIQRTRVQNVSRHRYCHVFYCLQSAGSASFLLSLFLLIVFRFLFLFCEPALVAEIKELKEKTQNEDDILLSISAGYKQPINPNLDYEYFSLAIHEDLYKLVHFSCEELCSTKEQLRKVLRLWENFLEPMLGVPPRAKGTDPVEDIPKSPDVDHSTSTNEKADGSCGADTATLHSRKLISVANGDQNASSAAPNPGVIGLLNKDSTGKDDFQDADTANRDGVTCSAVKLQKEHETGNRADQRSEMPIPMDISERASTSSLSAPSGENNHRVVEKEDLAGTFQI